MLRPFRLTHWLAYVALRVVAIILAAVPIEAARRAMCRLGAAWFTVPHALPESRVPPGLARIPLVGAGLLRLSLAGNKVLRKFREHRNRAEFHIRRSFPELGEPEVSAMARASMEHLAMFAVEVLRTPHLVRPWSWSRHIRLGQLDEAIRVLLRRKGCIMLTGHYGSWELLGFALATLGFDIVAVMRPLDNEYINRYLLDVRERSGLRLLYKKGATASADEVLESGGALCFIADQNAGAKGLFVDFFGIPASTYKSIGLLAIHHEAPIVCGCARRISPRFEYEIDVNRIIEPHEWQGRDDPLMWVTAEFTRAIEDFIRKAPEQYLWIHRRWKSRPKNEEALPGSQSN